MKTSYRLLMGVALVAVMMSCKDRALERRIADLESRMSQVEGKGSGATVAPITASTAATPAAPVAAAEEKPEGPLPVIQFTSLDHDFGTVKEGEKVSYTYALKNTGEAPLVIQNASPSCGCTVPDWSKEPIPVGGTGFVKAEFDTNGKSGIQNKTITVTANTWPKVTTLRFKAMITPKSDGSNGPLK